MDEFIEPGWIKTMAMYFTPFYYVERSTDLIHDSIRFHVFRCQIVITRISF